MAGLTLGFIGLGIMGRPMVGHLLRVGHRVRVHTRTHSSARPALEAGAEWRDSAAAVAQQCDALLTMVTDGPDVEQALFGPQGAAAELPPGGLVIDLTTTSPATARSLHERLGQHGVAFLDAPVTGGEAGAVNAALTIMVGGESSAFERARPILEAFARKIVRVGPSGAGQTLKACNQTLCAVNMIGVCEALLIAQSAGIEPQLALDTLSSGAGGSWAWTTLGAKIVAGDLKPAFMIKLMQKDLRIAQTVAEESSIPLPGVALAQQLFRAVTAEPGGAELGTQGMFRAYQNWIGRRSSSRD